jgi:hypothetical protein
LQKGVSWEPQPGGHTVLSKLQTGSEKKLSHVPSAELARNSFPPIARPFHFRIQGHAGGTARARKFLKTLTGGVEMNSLKTSFPFLKERNTKIMENEWPGNLFLGNSFYIRRTENSFSINPLWKLTMPFFPLSKQKGFVSAGRPAALLEILR